MQYKLLLVLAFVFVVGTIPGFAQQYDNVELEETDMPVKLLPYNNPMVEEDDDFAVEKEPKPARRLSKRSIAPDCRYLPYACKCN